MDKTAWVRIPSSSNPFFWVLFSLCGNLTSKSTKKWDINGKHAWASMATMNGIVYVITNTVNARIYVGSTTRKLQQRWTEHQYDAKTASMKPLHVAMRELGVDNFKIKAVRKVSCNTMRELHEAETLVMKKYRSLQPSGYNAVVPFSFGMMKVELRLQYGAAF